LRIQFPIPQHIQRLTLGIIIHARQPEEERIRGIRRGNYVINKIQPLANRDDLANFWNKSLSTHLGSRLAVS
jgi:hypothetical protein